jgi:hypothetical protein
MIKEKFHRYCTLIPFIGWCISVYDLMSIFFNPYHDWSRRRWHVETFGGAILYIIIQAFSFAIIDYLT